MRRNIRDEKGMMTVEVLIGITIYIGFFVLMMNLLNVIYIKQKVQAAMKPIAIQISRDYAVDETIADGGMGYEKIMLSELMRRRRQGIMSEEPVYVPVGDARYRAINQAEQMLLILMADFKTLGYATTEAYVDMWIVGGYGGISFDGTKVDENGSGELELVVEYKIRIANLPLFGDAGIYIPVKQTASTRLWK